MDWNKPLGAEENLGFVTLMAMIGIAACTFGLIAVLGVALAIVAAFIA